MTRQERIVYINLERVIYTTKAQQVGMYSLVVQLSHIECMDAIHSQHNNIPASGYLSP